MIACLIALVAEQPYPLVVQAQQTAVGQGGTLADLTIRVLQGEQGVNIIKKKSAVKPVIEVRDKNNLPVAGAAVTFILPQSGASAVFAHGSKTLTVLTNSAGRAAVTSMNPVGTGAFNIGVSATYQGQLATATIAQTNFATAAAAGSATGGAAGAAGGATGGAGGAAGGAAAGGAAAGAGAGISAATIGIIAAGAAAAVAGVAVAKKGGSKGPTTISAGAPQLGRFH